MSQNIGKKGRNFTAKPRKKPTRTDIARAQQARRRFYSSAFTPSEPQEDAAEVA
jgi:hypothetical protein